MQKKIKFSLTMAYGVKVRSLSYLREYFDPEKFIEYYLDGRLERWLSAHEYDEMAKAVKAVDINASDAMSQVCNILGIMYNGDICIKNPAFTRRTYAKKAILKQMTSNKWWINSAARVAFTDDDVKEILGMGYRAIYLCGRKFHIPTEYQNIGYAGICGFIPEILIDFINREDMLEAGIHFENVVLPSRLNARNIPQSNSLLGYGISLI